MNRIFKSLWNDARQQYVVTNEKQVSRGKRTKSALTVAIALAVASGAALAAYSDPGKIGDKASWETSEYKMNWGLTALKASSAYALGFHGQGVKLGIMDSGAHMQINPELTGDRFHVTHATGVYGQSGQRYPQALINNPGGDAGVYTEGEAFDITGDFILGVNDSHGTKVAGSMGANRDGSGMHGVSWGSELYSGNTGGTDSSNYGPFLDYNFFKAGYDALVSSGVKIINNSFGTNLKQIRADGTAEPYYTSGPELTTVADIEYEYFLFKQKYAGKKSFVDAAWDAIKDKDVIQVFTNGNNQRDNPYHRALYPYFHPEAENQWIAIAGLRQTETDPNSYMIETNFNEAGYAKYWTLTGPGQNGYSTAVDPKTGKLQPAYDRSGKHYEEGYGSFSGTSMAAPYISGAFGVLASRYPDMTAQQVRQVLLTTANHKNADGSVMEGWANRDGTMPAEGEVSDRMGWGVPDLGKGMYGPGQLFGHFDYNLSEGNLDVWSNDISQVALDQRHREDIEWLTSVTDDGTVDGEVQASKGGDYKLDNEMEMAGIEDKTIEASDGEAWRQEYFNARAKAIREKLKGDLYNGKLIKRGKGTLVMTGNNTYRGGTVVEEGTLLGFDQSFGVTDAAAQTTSGPSATPALAPGNGQVVVNGGTFGIISSYEDTLTLQGTITDTDSSHSVDVKVNNGGTLQVAMNQQVTAGDIVFNEGSAVSTSTTQAQLQSLYDNGGSITGTIDANSVTGLENAAVQDLALFDVSVTESSGTITATVASSDSKTLASYATNANERAIASAIASDSALTSSMLTATSGQARSTMKSLGSDFFLNARNASAVNGLTLTRAVRDQAAGIGSGRHAEMLDGHGRLWATGIGSWSSLDFGQSDIDSDFYAALIGGEVDATDNTKFGVFFGAGTTTDKDGGAKWDSNDVHVGLYGLSTIKDVAQLQYGVTYTKSDADQHRTLSFAGADHYVKGQADTNTTQVYLEGAWKGFNTDAFGVEPYLGVSWLHIESDDFTEQLGSVTMKTSIDDQDIGVGTLGVRGSLPFTLGGWAFSVKGDVAWNHFFGDNRAESNVILGSGAALLKGGKLDDMASVGLGIEAQLGKSATFGLSYVGAYGDDVTSNGVNATLRVLF